MTKNKAYFIKQINIIADIVITVFSFIIAYHIRDNYFSSTYGRLPNIKHYIWVLWVIIPILPICMQVFNLYNYKNLFRFKKNIFIRLMGAVSLASLLISTTIYLSGEGSFSRLFFGIFALTNFTLLYLEKLIFIFVLNTFKTKKIHHRRVIAAGNLDKIKSFEKYISDHPELMIDIIGIIPFDHGTNCKEDRVLGNMDNLVEIVKEHVVDEVVFTSTREYLDEIEKYAVELESMGLTVNFIADLYNFKISKTEVNKIGDLPVITFHTVSLDEWQNFFKRLLDIVGAIVGLFITGIVLIFVGPAIKLESKGPIFFSQDRVGKNGRIFKCYKFRSMYIDAEERKKELMKYNEMKGAMFKIKDDPRITKVGKFLRATSLDELPQFWNVLMGDMSLVGTRPPTVDEVEQYKNYHRRRISIKPGITGMWQVSGRNEINDFEEIVKMDISYIDNWSIWLDIKILFKTIFVVLTKAGAY